MKFRVQRHKLTKRLRPNYRTIECLPSPTSHHYIAKVYLQLFLLWVPCLVIKKKLWNTLNGKEHNLRRQSKHQNQTWQRFTNYQSGNFKQLWLTWTFPSDSVIKNPSASVGDTGSNPGLGRSLEKEMLAYSSILAWEIPWREGPGGLQSVGSQKSWTWLSD